MKDYAKPARRLHNEEGKFQAVLAFIGLVGVCVCIYALVILLK
jgi:hypothetical protein